MSSVELLRVDSVCVEVAKLLQVRIRLHEWKIEMDRRASPKFTHFTFLVASIPESELSHVNI